MILLDIALSILECHLNSVIHRDIKLENIMVGPRQATKLIDFGYGKVVSKFDNALYRFCGTPYYIAPEMIRKKPYDGGESRRALIGREEDRCVVLWSVVF